jgi:hypothetical protein
MTQEAGPANHQNKDEDPSFPQPIANKQDTALIIGINQARMNAIKDILNTHGVVAEVLLGSDGLQSYTPTQQPSMVFCEYQNNEESLDTAKLQTTLKRNAATQRAVFLVVADKSDVELASARFDEKRVIAYFDRDQLEKEIDLYLERYL